MLRGGLAVPFLPAAVNAADAGAAPTAEPVPGPAKTFRFERFAGWEVVAAVRGLAEVGEADQSALCQVAKPSCAMAPHQARQSRSSAAEKRPLHLLNPHAKNAVSDS
jgi:hypothetical protein